MNVKKELEWIISEIKKIEDPDLILAFKSLLNYHIKHSGKK